MDGTFRIMCTDSISVVTYFGTATIVSVLMRPFRNIKQNNKFYLSRQACDILSST